jgi:di/tricarboxylate transporter
VSVALVLAIVVLAVVLFSVESIPIEVSALTVVAALALTGVLTPAQAFAGFSNDTVIFIFTLLAMTQGLASTGVVGLIGQRLSFFARYGHQWFVLALMGAVAAFSSFVSNTVTTAAFLPVAIGAAARAKVPKSKVLMPLAYASMLGGTVFLYGTSTNLVVSAAMDRLGLGPIGVAELTPVGIPIVLVGVAVVVLLGPLLLPSRADVPREGDVHVLRDYLTEAVLPPDSRYVGRELGEITDGLGFKVLGLLREGKALLPEATQVLQRDDRLIIEGSRADMLRVKDVRGLELRSELLLPPAHGRPDDSVLVETSVPPGSPLVSRSLKEVLFSERFGLVALAIHRRPAIQRLTKLQMLQRVLWGGHSLSTLALSVGDVLLLRGPRSRVQELADGTTLLVLSDVEYQPPRYGKALTAVCIFGGALLAGTLELVPLSLTGLVGMLAMIATGCVDPRTAFRVDWRVVLLIGSMMALGVAMETSGAGRVLGAQVARVGELGGERGVLVALMVLTILLSAPMSNQAAALVVLPVAVSAAADLGVDPRSFCIGVCLAASCSFITPLEPSCVLVYGPGHYKFTDFFRLGTPLTLAMLALLSVAVPLVWPFHHPAGARGQGLAPVGMTATLPAHAASGPAVPALPAGLQVPHPPLAATPATPATR